MDTASLLPHNIDPNELLALLTDPALRLRDIADDLSITIAQLLDAAESPIVTAALTRMDRLDRRRARRAATAAAPAAAQTLELLLIDRAAAPETRRKAATKILNDSRPRRRFAPLTPQSDPRPRSAPLSPQSNRAERAGERGLFFSGGTRVPPVCPGGTRVPPVCPGSESVPPVCPESMPIADKITAVPPPVKHPRRHLHHAPRPIGHTTPTPPTPRPNPLHKLQPPPHHQPKRAPPTRAPPIMAKKKKKQVKKPKPKSDKGAEVHLTDPKARGHTGQYGSGPTGAQSKGGSVTKINKSSGGRRGV